MISFRFSFGERDYLLIKQGQFEFIRQKNYRELIFVGISDGGGLERWLSNVSYAFLRESVDNSRDSGTGILFTVIWIVR